MGRLVRGALCAALLIVGKEAMSFLPNIEPVSLLIILYTLCFGLPQTLWITITFVMVQGFLYGFGMWWPTYLYLWPLLAVVAHLCRRCDSAVLWAVISGAFGLTFGAHFAIPYAITGGMYAGVSYWITGIPWDAVHCIGNFLLMLLLYRPLKKGLERIAK